MHRLGFVCPAAVSIPKHVDSRKLPLQDWPDYVYLAPLDFEPQLSFPLVICPAFNHGGGMALFCVTMVEWSVWPQATLEILSEIRGVTPSTRPIAIGKRSRSRSAAPTLSFWRRICSENINQLVDVECRLVVGSRRPFPNYSWFDSAHITGCQHIAYML